MSDVIPRFMKVCEAQNVVALVGVILAVLPMLPAC